MASALVDQRDQARPQGRDSTGATDDSWLTSHEDAIPAVGRGIAGYIRYAAARLPVVHAGGQRGALLERGHRKHITDATPGTAVAVVPDHFTRDRIAGNRDRGATTADRPGTGRREIHVCLAIGHAVGGQTIAGRDAYGHG